MQLRIGDLTTKNIFVHCLQRDVFCFLDLPTDFKKQALLHVISKNLSKEFAKQIIDSFIDLEKCFLMLFHGTFLVYPTRIIFLSFIETINQ